MGAGTAASLVGRALELKVLADALGEAAGGGRSVALVTGEAGIGKTALAREHATRAEAAGVAVLWGACLEGGWQPPIEPWADALAAAGEAVAVSAAPLPGPEARLRVFAEVRAALGRVTARRSALLVLDDLHWAAPDALDLLLFVAAQHKPRRLAVLATCREPDPAANDPRLVEALARLARCEGFAALRLSGLADGAVGDYLAQRYGGPLPGQLVRTLGELAGGNPFYVREVVAHLVEAGRLRELEGRWTSDASLDELPVPDTVRRVVRARVARLAPATRSLLTTAAVLTVGFDLALVRDAAGLTQEVAVQAVDEALEAGLLVVAHDPDAPYTFAHAIVRMALLDELNPDRRAAVHRRVAEAAAALHPDRHALIAEHYGASRTLPGADAGVAHCLAAADEGARAGGPMASVRWLALALALTSAGDAPRRAVLQARLAAAQADALLTREAPATALEAAAALPDAEAASLLLRVASALRLGAPPAVWQPLADAALARCGERRDALWARIALLRDPVEPALSGPLSAGRWLGYPREVTALLADTGDEDDAAALFEPFAVRTPDETLAAYHRAARWSSPTARLRMLDLTGRDWSLRHAQPRRALACYEELLALALRVGSLPAQAEAQAQLGFCHALLGDIPAAEEHLALAAGLVASLWPGHRLVLLGTASHVTIVGYVVGAADWAPAAERLEQLVRGPAAAHAPWANVMISLAALAHAMGGARARATELLRHLPAVLAAMQPHDHAVPGSLWFGAAAAWELRDEAVAPALLDLVERHEAARPPPGPLPTLDHAAGRLLALQGDHEGAATRLAAARAAAEQHGLRPFAALADHDRASLGGPGASDLAEGAADAFASLGMRGWLARARPSRRPQAEGLTPREGEVVALLAAGATSKEIALRLVLSVATVNRHVANAYLKLGVRNRAEATAWAIANGLHSPVQTRRPGGVGHI